MTKNEARYVIRFLEELSERYGNDGCNDMILSNRKENVELVLAAETDAFGEDATITINYDKGTILTVNTFLVDYLCKVIAKDFNLTREDIPKL